MFTSRLSRYLSLSGAVGWLLLLIFNDIVNGGQPAYDADPSAWSTYLADHHGASTRAVTYVELLGLGLAMIFVGVLFALLRRAEGDRGLLAPLALLSGAVGVAVKVASAAPGMTAVYLSDKGLSPDTLRALENMGGAAFALTFIPNGIMMLALGAGVLSYRHMPSWLGWFGIVAGIGLIAGAPFVQDDGPGFIGMLLFIFWNIAASITLFVKWPAIVAERSAYENSVAKPVSAASLAT